MRILFQLIPVALALASTAAAQTCTFTNFSRPCGIDLAGSQTRGRTGPVLQMLVSGAVPGSVAILAAGHQTRTPSPLPNTRCLLLVDPRITLFQDVDRLGTATFLLNLPNVRFDVDFQAVTVSTSRHLRTAESSNGVNVVCR